MLAACGGDDEEPEPEPPQPQPQPVNQPPTADAGEELTIDAGGSVTLDGSDSSDPESTRLGYSWRQSAGQPTATLDDTDGARLIFTAPIVTEDATLTFALTVTDAGGRTATDTVRVIVSNPPPTANVGSDRAANSGQAVTLDGSDSSDPGDGTITYRWRQTSGEPTVTLADAEASAVQLIFTAPIVAEDTTLTFELTVTDAGDLTATDTVQVVVSNPPPTANAGSDRAADAGQVVTLDGSGSSDSDNGAITYRWRQTAGELTVTLADAEARVVQLTFTAPDVIRDATLTFELTVTDAGGLTDTDTVQVVVSNPPPTADAGSDGAANAGQAVTLDGSGSSDFGSSALRYAWTTHPGVTLTGGDTATPSFTAPTTTMTLGFTFTFELAVTDQGGLVARDSVSIRVAGDTELFTMDDHDGPVRGVSISDDGSRAVSGGIDGTVRLWNARAGEEIRFDGGARSLGQHDGAVYAVAISGDGSRAISGDVDGAVHLWNTATGERVRSLRSSGLWVYAVALDEDGSHAAAGGFDGKVRFWNAATGAQKRPPGTHTIGGVPTSVYSVALSGDGGRALSGGAGGNVYLWDTTTDGNPVRRFGNASAMGPVFGVALSGDGEMAVAGSADNKVRAWNATNGNELHELPGHQGDVSSVSLNAAKTRVLSTGGDGTARLWNVDTNDSASDRAVRAVRLHTDYVWSAGLSNDGLVLSGGADGLVNAWNAAAPPTDVTGSLQSSEPDIDPGRLGDVRSQVLPNGHTNHVNDVALSADGRRAISGSEDNTVRLWDTATGEHLHTITGHTGHVWGVALSADGRIALSGSEDNTVRLWNAATGEHLHTMTGHTDIVRGVALNADGRIALSGSEDNTVRLWNATTGEHLHTMTGHTDHVNEVALSADGRSAVSGSFDDTVRLWNAATGEHLHTLTGHGDDVMSVVLNADGGFALSGGRDNSVRLWNATSGRHLRTLTGHTNHVLGVALSADGRIALSGSHDDDVRLWDTATGEHLRTLAGHTSWVRDVALSADGRIALSGARDDNTTRLWHFGRSHATPATPTAAAKAGDDQTIESAGVVTLDGSDSTDTRTTNGKPIAYHWRQTAGTPVTLSANDAETATFTTPPLVTSDTILVFELTVTDANGLFNTEQVSITIAAQLTARAGDDQTVAPGTVVTLDGSDSFDPKGNALTYAWSQPSGQNIGLSSTSASMPTFTAPTTIRSEATFTLTVTDANDLTAQDSVTVRVSPITMEDRATTVRGVSISRTGNLAVSGDTDGTVQLWNASTGEAIHTLGSHEGPVYAVAINADGTRAVSGGADGTVRLWTWDGSGGNEVLYGNETRSLGDKGIWVYAVALNADGSRAASGGFDGTVRVWNTNIHGANAGEEITYGSEGRSLGSHGQHSVYGVSLSDNGDRVLSGGAGGTVRLWNVANGEQENIFSDDDGPMGVVFGVALSGDGSVAVAGSADNHVHVWNADTGDETHELVGHSADVSSVSLNEAKTRVLSADGDGAVRFWNVDTTDAANGTEIRTLRRHTNYVWSVALSGDGVVALSGGSDGRLHLWNTAAQPTDTTEAFATTESDRNPTAMGDIRSRVLPGRHNDAVWGVSLSTNGRRALSGSQNELFLWDATTGRMIGFHTGNAVSQFRGVSLSANGRLALSGSSSPEEVQFWDAKIDLLRTMSGRASGVLEVALSADGRLALSGSLWRDVYLWDTATGRRLHTMSGHAGDVLGVALSADSSHALSGSKDNTVRLWDTAMGRHLRTMTGHTDDVVSVSLSPDGRLALSGSRDDTVRLWNATTGEHLHTMTGHTGDVLSVSLSADGRLALSGSRDDTVRLWDTSTGKLLRTMTGHTDDVLSVSLGAYGHLALSGAVDETTRLWHLRKSNTTLISSTADAVAGPNQTVNPGSRVTLDGSGSTDSSTTTGKPIAHHWRQTAGDDMMLSSNDTETTAFTAPTPPHQTVTLQPFVGPPITIKQYASVPPLTFELTATDSLGLVDTDTVTIYIDTRPRQALQAPTKTTAHSRFIATANAPPDTHPPSLTGAAPNLIAAPSTTTDAGMVENVACASHVDDTGRTTRGQTHRKPDIPRGGKFGYDCVYPTSFLDVDNPLDADMTIHALPNSGVHIFQGSLVVGHGRDADASIAQGNGNPTLTIEPGAVLAFEQPSGSLVINRGARLLAVGTPDKPITLTSRSNTQGAASQSDGDSPRTYGAGGTASEGTEVPDNPDTRAWVGLNIRGNGSDGKDSGHLEYLVVKHAGTSDTGGIELHNVGSSTTVRNLQAYASHGDGLALVGGDVHVENFVAVYAQGDSIDIGGGWSGTLTNALVIQSQHGGDHCLNIHGPGQESTDDPASGRITGLTCITSSHTAGANNLGAGIRLDANAAPVIERSLVVGVFSDDTDPRINYCLRLDNHAQQSAGDESLIPNVPALTGNIFACEDKTTNTKVEAWLASGNNQFADVTAPTDPTTATDTHLQLLGGKPPVYSLRYGELQVDGTGTTVTPPNGADFPGAASQSTTPSWLRPDGIDWTHGIFEGSRDEPLWFEPAR